MTIRIRVQLGPDFERTLARQRQIASILAAFLTPVAVSAFLLCVWRLGSDIGWAGEFAISHGLLSHWQVWLVIAGLLQTVAVALNRFGHSGRLTETFVSHAEPVSVPAGGQPKADMTFGRL